MTRRTLFAVALSLLAVTLFSTSIAFALTKEELKERFKSRYASLVAAKESGKVGETYKGYVEAVKSDADKATTALVADENGDRKELYDMLAKEEKATPEKVGEVNGERNFKKAAPGTYLKGKDGKWVQKEKDK